MKPLPIVSSRLEKREAIYGKPVSSLNNIQSRLISAMRDEFEPPHEKRKHPRRKGFWRAVAFLSGRAPLNCIVRNISEGGALLEFSEAPRFPARFRLYIEEHNSEYYCEVRHSGDYGVGVYFFDKTPCQPHDMAVHFGKRSKKPNADMSAIELSKDAAPVAHR